MVWCFYFFKNFPQFVLSHTVKGFDIVNKIEENNRMGKTRDLFRKIADTKGTFHAKMGTIKGQKWYGPNRSR